MQKLAAVNLFKNIFADKVGQQYSREQQKSKVQRLALIGAGSQILQKNKAGGSGTNGKLSGTNLFFFLKVQQNINVKQPLTAEQVKMLEKLKEAPVTYDDDSPELTDEQLMEFKRLADIKRDARRKQSVTLRLSPQAAKKARSLGKGYTSVLSRILESALEDNDLIQRFL